jgi:3-phenylpropionate/trans-cinnamate dioxygenase ferredoxin subunit
MTEFSTGAMVERTERHRRVPVCRLTDLRDGDVILVDRVTADSPDDIALFYDGGRLYAVNDTCTHGAASLSEGWVDGGEIECPLHGGRFDLRNGAAVGLPAARDTTVHDVEIHDGTVVVLPSEDPPR